MALHPFFILGIAALVLVPGTASAQDARQYHAWDRNRDGAITRAEWRGPLQEFRERDWNADGVLSGREMWNDSLEQADDQWGVNDFLALDRNRNGRVSRGEWRGDRATFFRIDRNNDNQITRDEFLTADAADGEPTVGDFDSLDIDYSERVERDEWNGTRAAFNRLDVNRDGVLSRRELAGGDVVRTSTDDFGLLDDNNNGVISRAEWRSALGNFTRYDVNGDGVVTRGEFSAPAGAGGVEHTMTIDSRQAWTDTGIHVNAGDRVTYRATGTIQMSTDANDRATAAGSLSGRTARNSPRPDQKAGGLLLRVGNSPIVFLGESGMFTAQNSGRLSLGVNDDHLADNTGEYRVWVSVDPR
jgi:hypothetical protein